MISPRRVLLSLLTSALSLAALGASSATGAVARDDGSWARPAAERLAAEGLWQGAIPRDLSRPAPRRALVRALHLALTSEDAPAPAPLEPVSLPRLDDVRTDDRDRLAVEYVVGLKLLGTKAGSFMPAHGLSLAQARLAVVRGLGLESERAAIQGLSGLRMPAFAGSEVLARELGLVGNHLAEADARERHASDQLSWAELFTLMDRLREVSSWDLERLGVFRQIAFPEFSPRERAVIQAGISQIGHPYVWGGSAPGRAGTTRRGAGFDCSGLVWWAYASAGQGESIHRWRSTAAAFAMTRGARHVPVAAAGPGDLVFYGAKGEKTRRSKIEHVGIALGGGWMLHSSGGRGGPTISYLPHYWSEGEVSARLIG